MTICDLCQSHVSRRITINLELKMSNIKTVDYSELIEGLRLIKEGLRVCGDCKTECRKGGIRDCSASMAASLRPGQYNAIIQIKNERLAKKIYSEITRRKNVKHVLQSINVGLPAFPVAPNYEV